MEGQREALGPYYTLVVEELTRANFTRSRLYVAPNPTREGYVEVLWELEEEGFFDLRLVDLQGREIQSSKLPNNQKNRLDVSRLAKGVYVVKMRLPDGRDIIRRLQVE